MDSRAGLLPWSLLGLALAGCRGSSEEPKPIAPWPPVVGQPFPEFTALDHEGEPFELDSLRGRVLLIEPVNMANPACIAFSGGAECGPFEGTGPQPGLDSIAEYFRAFAGRARFDEEDIAVVKLLFFDRRMRTPTPREAEAWVRHFRTGSRANHYVLIGPESLRRRAYYSIPGFWLVDRNFVLRCDATGREPPSSLYSDLLPMVAGLLDEVASTPR